MPTSAAEVIKRMVLAPGAGHGSLIEAENIDQHLAFRESWVQRLGLKSENLIAIYARGDSMEPTIFQW